MLPYRETQAIEFYRHTMRDGTEETMAFFKTTINGWSPMISVWLIDPNDDRNSQEDQITFNGVTYAYCISDQTTDEWDDLRLVDTIAVDPIDMLVIGSLMRRVI
jgi:hypothetical protein